MTHWHVANGTPGYLYDSEPPLPTYATRAEATAYAREEAREEAYARNDAARYVPGPAYALEPLTGGRYATGTHYVRRVLPRDETWTADTRVGRSGPFAVAIDRRRDPYTLPYRWDGWPCDDADCEDSDDA